MCQDPGAVNCRPPPQRDRWVSRIQGVQGVPASGGSTVSGSSEPGGESGQFVVTWSQDPEAGPEEPYQVAVRQFGDDLFEPRMPVSYLLVRVAGAT